MLNLPFDLKIYEKTCLELCYTQEGVLCSKYLMVNKNNCRPFYAKFSIDDELLELYPYYINNSFDDSIKELQKEEMYIDTELLEKNPYISYNLKENTKELYKIDINQSLIYKYKDNVLETKYTTYSTLYFLLTVNNICIDKNLLCSDYVIVSEKQNAKKYLFGFKQNNIIYNKIIKDFL